MALKPCQECGHEISDRAGACPHCGAPTSSTALGNRPGVVTTEATGKGFKLAQAFGVVAMLIGASLMAVGIDRGGGGPTGGGILFSVAGLVTYLAARIGAWWHHR